MRIHSSGKTFLIVVTMVVFAATQNVAAITKGDLFSVNNNTSYYQPGCETSTASTTEAISAGTGKPDGATFPKLDPAAMASSIDRYVKKTNSNSELNDLGLTIVASAKNANINPFMVVAIARVESSLADPSDFNVKKGHNAFGRTAASGQPSFQGDRTWYKWSSAKASVDYTTPENKNITGGGDIMSYIQKQYKSDIASDDFEGLFTKYAPPGDGNDTDGYIRMVKEWIKDMADGSGSTAAVSSAPEPIDASQCECPSATTASATGTSTGSEIGKNEYSAGDEYAFLIGKGLSPLVSAAIVGNAIWESGGDQGKLTIKTENPSSLGANGIHQWYQGRLVALKALAAKQNKPWTDLSVQLDYLWVEFETTQKANLGAVKAQTNIEGATVVFEKKFEVSGDTASYPVRIALAKKVLQKFNGTDGTSDTTTDASLASSAGCEGAENTNGGGAAFTLDGYTWPVDLNKATVDSGYPWPCQSTCHHDRTAAFDLSAKGAVRSNDDSSAIGKATYAITDGTVDNLHIYNGIDGCYSLQLKSSKDGFSYYYTHMRKPSIQSGAKVKSGDKLAEIGERKCTGNGSYPHLHIDRGSPKGSPGGYTTGSDMGFVGVLNKIYSNLP